MEHSVTSLLRRALVVVAVALMAAGCSDTISTVGLAIRPDADRIDVFADTFLVEASNNAVSAISAQADTMVLGCFYSPTYGTTRASLLVQFAAPEGYAFPDASYRPQPDSLVLVMYYNSYFGSAYAPMELSVYEMNKGSIRYSDRYYSDLRIGDYTDSTILMGRRVMTSVDLSRGNAQSLDSATTPYVRYRFDDSQRDRFYGMISGGEPLTTDDFLSRFRGMYITASYGTSTLLYINQATLFLYYHYTYLRDGHDTIVTTSVAFPANHEVRQLNSYSHPGRSALLASTPDSTLLIKSMAGFYPKVRIPYGRILRRFHERIDTATRIFNISAAELTLECEQYDDRDVYMDPPTYLLAISTDAYDDFLRHNIPPAGTETDRVLGKYSPATNSYTFDMAYLLSRTLRDPSISPDSVFEFILMPVEATTAVSALGSQNAVQSIRPLVKLAAVKARSGSNSYSPLRLKILYDSY